MESDNGQGTISRDATQGAVGEQVQELSGGFSVLVADGNSAASAELTRALESAGHDAVTAATAEEALALVEKLHPDLVVVDALLPEHGGAELCRRIRERYTPNALPLILVAEKSGSAVIAAATAAGANDFVAKPVVREEFLARVDTNLNLARITSIYNRFLPTELLDLLGRKNILDLRLGDQIQREMTVLFADIRDFTSLSERMTPQENFKFINSYLSRITPLIRKYNGFVDKYIGDAIMAIYPRKPDDAIRSAVSIIEYLAIYNGFRAKSGYRPINVGIGIHTGNLIMGIIGDNQRMEGTVISDAVNLASRVQDVTKLYGSNIIISQETFVRLDNPTDYNFRFLGKVKVKGKLQTVSLFEVFNGDSSEQIALKSQTKSDFENAILLFSKRRFDEALDLFRNIVAKNSGDRAASLFLNRADALLKREKASWLLK